MRNLKRKMLFGRPIQSTVTVMRQSSWQKKPLNGSLSHRVRGCRSAGPLATHHALTKKCSGIRRRCKGSARTPRADTESSSSTCAAEPMCPDRPDESDRYPTEGPPCVSRHRPYRPETTSDHMNNEDASAVKGRARGRLTSS